jgi:hypothetical protein
VLLGVVFDGSFAAAAGVDLSFDDGERSAELFERSGGFIGGGGHDARGHGDAGIAEELFSLVFVYFHPGTFNIAVSALFNVGTDLTQRRRGRRVSCA